MQNRIIFITGRKGCGKTTYAADMARKLYLSGQRVVVVDPMNGFDLPGAPVVSSCSEIIGDRLHDRSFVAVPGTDPRLPEAVFLFCYITGNLWLFVDEIDLYLPHGMPDGSLLNAIRYGRHRGLSLVGISQRPANVVRDLTAQSDLIVMFQTAEPRDLEYLAGRIGRENADRVQGLEQFRSLTYSAYHGRIMEGGDVMPGDDPPSDNRPRPDGDVESR
jgi:hypothetical protein